MRSVDKIKIILDRTAVLFIGLALGGVITFSFFASGEPTSASKPGELPAAVAANPAVVPAAAAPRQSDLAPNLAAAVEQGRTVQIGVFGDSFGDGIWTALQRQLDDDETLKVHRFSKAATGFTSYQLTNVLDAMRAKLDRQPVDIAVVSFGANDTQGIYLEDGSATPYMSEDWQRVIGARVDAVVQLLKSRGAQVYWIGLPKMRSDRYDANVQKMNAFFAGRMQALGVSFVETASLTVDQAGRYAPYLPDPETGRRMSMRNNDGIHMSMNGYEVLTRSLADRIRTTVDEARERSPAAHRQATGPNDSGARSRS